MSSNSARVLLALKGMTMGMAEVVPGVSGGTIAFITGIYERLINAIKSFGPQAVDAYRTDGVAGVWRAVDGQFLLTLFAGMFGGIVIGIFGITYLLENYTLQVWGFFSGLIAASAIYVGRQVTRWRWQEVVALLLAAAFAYALTVMSPAEGTDAYWMLFLSGALAVSALLLPGLSGSFVLLLLGMYRIVTGSVRRILEDFAVADILKMFVFGLGMIVGVVTFSRVLSWTFKRYESLTLATLTGFMIGSLNKVWPWRNVLTYRENSQGKQVPFLEEAVLPVNYTGDPEVLWVIIWAVIGFAGVFILERLGKRVG